MLSYIYIYKYFLNKHKQNNTNLSCVPAPKTPPDPSARPALPSPDKIVRIKDSKASFTLKFSFAYN